MDTIKNAYKCLYAVRYGTNWRGNYQDGPNASIIAKYGDCTVTIGWVPDTEHVRCVLTVADKTYSSEIYTGWNDADKWSTAVAEVWLKFCDSYASELI